MEDGQSWELAPPCHPDAALRVVHNPRLYQLAFLCCVCGKRVCHVDFEKDFTLEKKEIKSCQTQPKQP